MAHIKLTKKQVKKLDTILDVMMNVWFAIPARPASKEEKAFFNRICVLYSKLGSFVDNETNYNDHNDELPL